MTITKADSLPRKAFSDCRLPPSEVIRRADKQHYDVDHEHGRPRRNAKQWCQDARYRLPYLHLSSLCTELVSAGLGCAAGFVQEARTAAKSWILTALQVCHTPDRVRTTNFPHRMDTGTWIRPTHMVRFTSFVPLPSLTHHKERKVLWVLRFASLASLGKRSL